MAQPVGVPSFTVTDHSEDGLTVTTADTDIQGFGRHLVFFGQHEDGTTAFTVDPEIKSTQPLAERSDESPFAEYDKLCKSTPLIRETLRGFISSSEGCACQRKLTWEQRKALESYLRHAPVSADLEELTLAIGSGSEEDWKKATTLCLPRLWECEESHTFSAEEVW